MLRALLLVAHGATVLGEPCARADDCSGAGDVCVHPSGGVVPSDAYGRVRGLRRRRRWAGGLRLPPERRRGVRVHE
jgi:hypothetical protein